MISSNQMPQSTVRKKMATGTFTHNKENHKNAQKSSKNFKPSIHNVVSTGTNFAKICLSDVPIGCVRFARYCGKMYRCHLFSYGGFQGIVMLCQTFKQGIF